MENFNLDDKFRKLQNFDGTINKTDIQEGENKTNQNILSKIFDIFDNDKNGILEGQEVKNIFSFIKESGKKDNNNSIFETGVVEDFLYTQFNDNPYLENYNINTGNLNKLLLNEWNNISDNSNKFIKKIFPFKEEEERIRKSIKDGTITTENIASMTSNSFIEIFGKGKNLPLYLFLNKDLVETIIKKQCKIAKANGYNQKDALNSLFTNNNIPIPELKSKDETPLGLKGYFDSFVEKTEKESKEEELQISDTQRLINFFLLDNDTDNENKLYNLTQGNIETTNKIFNNILLSASKYLPKEEYNQISNQIEKIIKQDKESDNKLDNKKYSQETVKKLNDIIMNLIKKLPINAAAFKENRNNCSAKDYIDYFDLSKIVELPDKQQNRLRYLVEDDPDKVFDCLDMDRVHNIGNVLLNEAQKLSFITETQCKNFQESLTNINDLDAIDCEFAKFAKTIQLAQMINEIKEKNPVAGEIIDIAKLVANRGICGDDEFERLVNSFATENNIPMAFYDYFNVRYDEPKLKEILEAKENLIETAITDPNNRKKIRAAEGKLESALIRAFRGDTGERTEKIVRLLRTSFATRKGQGIPDRIDGNPDNLQMTTDNKKIYAPFYENKGIAGLSETTIIDYFLEKNVLSDSSKNKLQILTQGDPAEIKKVFDTFLFASKDYLEEEKFEQISKQFENILKDKGEKHFTLKEMKNISASLEKLSDEINKNKEDKIIYHHEGNLVTIKKGTGSYISLDYYKKHNEEINLDNVADIFSSTEIATNSRDKAINPKNILSYLADGEPKNVRNIASLFIEKAKNIPTIPKKLYDEYVKEISSWCNDYIDENAISKLNRIFNEIAKQIKQAEKIEEIKQKNPEAGVVVDRALYLLNTNKLAFKGYEDSKGIFAACSEGFYWIFGQRIDTFCEKNLQQQQEAFNEMVKQLALHPDEDTLKTYFKKYFHIEYNAENIENALKQERNFISLCTTPTNITNPNEKIKRTSENQIDGNYYKEHFDEISEDNILELFFHPNKFNQHDEDNRLKLLTGEDITKIETLRDTLLKAAEKRLKEYEGTEEYENLKGKYEQRKSSINDAIAKYKEALAEKKKIEADDQKLQKTIFANPGAYRFDTQINAFSETSRLETRRINNNNELRNILKDLNKSFMDSSELVFTEKAKVDYEHAMNLGFGGNYRGFPQWLQDRAREQKEDDATFGGMIKMLVIAYINAQTGGGALPITATFLKAGAISAGATLGLNYLDRASSKDGIAAMSKEEHFALFKQAAVNGIMAMVGQAISMLGESGGQAVAQRFGLTDKAIRKLAQLKSDGASSAAIQAYLVKEIVSVGIQVSCDVVIDKLLALYQGEDIDIKEAFRQAILQEIFCEGKSIFKAVEGDNNIFKDPLKFAKDMRLKPGVIYNKDGVPEYYISKDYDKFQTIEINKHSTELDNKGTWIRYTRGNITQTDNKNNNCAIDALLSGLDEKTKRNILIRKSGQNIEVLINNNIVSISPKKIDGYIKGDNRFGYKQQQQAIELAVRNLLKVNEDVPLDAVSIAKVFGKENEVHIQLNDGQNIDELAETLNKIKESGGVLTLVGNSSEIAKLFGNSGAPTNDNHAITIKRIKAQSGKWVVECYDPMNPNATKEIELSTLVKKGFHVMGGASVKRVILNNGKMLNVDDGKSRIKAGGMEGTDFANEKRILEDHLLELLSNNSANNSINVLIDFLGKIDSLDNATSRSDTSVADLKKYILTTSNKIFENISNINSDDLNSCINTINTWIDSWTQKPMPNIFENIKHSCELLNIAADSDYDIFDKIKETITSNQFSSNYNNLSTNAIYENLTPTQNAINIKLWLMNSSSNSPIRLSDLINALRQGHSSSGNSEVMQDYSETLYKICQQELSSGQSLQGIYNKIIDIAPHHLTSDATQIIDLYKLAIEQNQQISIADAIQTRIASDANIKDFTKYAVKMNVPIDKIRDFINTFWASPPAANDIQKLLIAAEGLREGKTYSETIAIINHIDTDDKLNLYKLSIENNKNGDNLHILDRVNALINTPDYLSNLSTDANVKKTQLEFSAKNLNNRYDATQTPQRIINTLKRSNNIAPDDAKKILSSLSPSNIDAANSKFNQGVGTNRQHYIDRNIMSEINRHRSSSSSSPQVSTGQYSTNISNNIRTFTDSLNNFISRNGNILGRFDNGSPHPIMRFLDRMECVNSDGTINEDKALLLIDYMFAAIEDNSRWGETIGTTSITPKIFIRIPNPLDGNGFIRIGINDVNQETKIDTIIDPQISTRNFNERRVEFPF